jgi:hypothetical protein
MDKTNKNNPKYWLLGASWPASLPWGFPIGRPRTLKSRAGHLAWHGSARGWRSSRCRLRIGYASVILVLGGSVPAAVLARVAVDMAKDPTSDNLWPFEFIIAAIVGVLCSSAGRWLEACLHSYLPTERPPNRIVRTITLWCRRIPFHGKIVFIPVEHAAFEIGDVVKAEAGQNGSRRRAADAGTANHDDVAVFMLLQLFRAGG